MKDKSEIVKIISKYVILLIVLYAIQFLIQYVIRFYFQPEAASSNLKNLLLNVIPVGIVVIGNLIAMLFVMKDKKRYKIENRYLEVLTLFFRPIGVCVLLIHIILDKKEESLKKIVPLEE